MLFDSKWKVKTDPLSLEAFADWLSRQPKDQKYEFWCNNCAIGSYLRSAGFQLKTLGCSVWKDLFGEIHDIPPGWNEISRVEPWTYGAAAERARQALNARTANV